LTDARAHAATASNPITAGNRIASGVAAFSGTGKPDRRPHERHGPVADL
jgi:hypothetical protein